MAKSDDLVADSAIMFTVLSTARLQQKFHTYFPAHPDGFKWIASKNRCAPHDECCASHQTQHSSTNSPLSEHAQRVAAGVLSAFWYLSSRVSKPGCLGTTSGLLSYRQRNGSYRTGPLRRCVCGAFDRRALTRCMGRIDIGFHQPRSGVCNGGSPYAITASRRRSKHCHRRAHDETHPPL